MSEKREMTGLGKEFWDKYMEKMKNDPVLNSPVVEFLTVHLSQYTVDRYKEWVADCNRKAVEKQRAEMQDPDEVYLGFWEMGYPYHGAIGGEITIEVKPTSLGDIVVAKYPYLNEEINLTEYSTW